MNKKNPLFLGDIRTRDVAVGIPFPDANPKGKQNLDFFVFE